MKSIIIFMVLFGSLISSISADVILIRVFGPYDYVDFNNIDTRILVKDFKDIASRYYQIPSDVFNFTLQFFQYQQLEDDKTLSYYGIQEDDPEYLNCLKLNADPKYLVTAVLVNYPKSLGGKQVSRPVKWLYTIKDIKELNEAADGIPVDKQVLKTEDGISLLDERTLVSYPLYMNASLYLSVKE